MSEKNIIAKHKIFLTNLDKEEIWINSFVERGYRLNKVNLFTCRYEFVKCEQTANMPFLPEVRIDYRLFKSNEKFNEYITMFEDSGWKHIAGTKSSGSQYFERRTSEATQNIFSDKDSKAGVYKRMSDYWLALFFSFLPIMVALAITGLLDFSVLYNWKNLYLTPGLWEMTGGEFWRAFWFETPFAVLRGGLAYFYLAIVLSYAYVGIRAWYSYRKEIKKQG